MGTRTDATVGCKPFCKAVGGKTQLLPVLLPLVPDAVRTGNARYFEPFVGGGALFFAVQPPYAKLNDSNRELVLTYTMIRDRLPAVVKELRALATLHAEDWYYKVRAWKPADLRPPQRAARFIYLNKTCFNGLWRVNRKGEFNVPFGRYTNPTICDEARLDECRTALRGVDVTLTNIDFEEIVVTAQPGDFVYFDPPYVPLTATSNFTSYGKDGFTDADQVRLRDLALRLKKRGCVVVVSNSSAPRVRELYAKGFTIREVDARRAINSNASKRGNVKEVIIT